MLREEDQKNGTDTNKPMLKKLYPKLTTVVAVIIRGEEDKGVQVWAFGKLVYQRMLGFFLDEEVGDILSPTEGFDLKVSITKQPGKQFNDTTVDPARKPTLLHADSATAQKWLESIPNLDDMYRLKSTQEIEAVLNNWLNGGTEAVHEGGTTRGAEPIDELDNLVSEVKSSAATDKKPVKKSEKTETKKQSLDDAFADLIGEE